MGWFNDLPEGWPLLVGAALVAVLLAESVYVLMFKARDYRANVNRRLQIQTQFENREQALIELKRERGITDTGITHPLQAIMRIIAQSGLSVGPQRIGMFWGLSAFSGLVAPVIADKTDIHFVVGGLAVGALIPLLVLRSLRVRRVKRFAEQFPDGIDVIVRSLKAGHPLPIAISLVAREMQDPIGTEFGMVADELSFGLDLESALRNLFQRVGQEDLPLFVTSISIQTATGGNLASILEGLSRVIRERFKMRRKIKALASEATISAYILVALPFIMAVLANLADPTFFNATHGKPETQTVIIGCITWMSIGVFFMRQLVKMKI
jgi:tight adherence protein B